VVAVAEKLSLVHSLLVTDMVVRVAMEYYSMALTTQVVVQVEETDKHH
jgi:hypothetical protein